MKKIFILSACAALAVVLVGFAVFQWFRIVGAALGDDAPPYYAREPEADNFTWPELPRDNGDGGDYIPEPAEPVEPPEEPEPTPQPTPTPFPEPIAITSVSGLGGAAYRGGLELPVAGATGWAAAYIYLLSEPRLPPPPPEEVYEEIYEDIYEDTYEDIYENYVYEECHYNYEAYYYEVYPCEDCDEIYAYDEYPAAEYPQYYEYLEPVEILAALSPGQAFVIILAYGDWWYVKLPDGLSGWVLHSGCFINLPDVIPSIVYRISNAYYSLKRSGEYEIPNISGQALYSAWAFNPRLGRYEFIVPALYASVRRIFAAQQAALAQGDTLVIYEAFRPRATQQNVVRNLQALMNENNAVYEALNTPPWHPGWFISHGISNHQRGAAIDASLGRVTEYEIRFINGFAYRRVTGFAPHEMPTTMHNLHPGAAVFTAPRSGTLAETMTEGALLLQSYFTRNGFTLLSSEWWHFDDPAGISVARAHNMTGDFFTPLIFSVLPNNT